MQAYKTIEAQSQIEFIEKKSRFIGYAAPVSTAEEALEFISKIKAKHWDATHNVFAYSLLGNTMRFSDDGEPQGTAGKPVLNCLDAPGIFNAVVVVTRYFGGILLGAGGLVRAYSSAASLALQESKIITVAQCDVISAKMSYSMYGKLLPLIIESGSLVMDTIFEDDVSVSFSISSKLSDNLIKKLIDASNGTVELRNIKKEFMKINTSN